MATLSSDSRISGRNDYQQLNIIIWSRIVIRECQNAFPIAWSKRLIANTFSKTGDVDNYDQIVRTSWSILLSGIAHHLWAEAGVFIAFEIFSQKAINGATLSENSKRPRLCGPDPTLLPCVRSGKLEELNWSWRNQHKPILNTISWLAPDARDLQPTEHQRATLSHSGRDKETAAAPEVWSENRTN